MVIALLAACTGRGPTPNTIDGVQIVAIRSVPAQPSTTGGMDLEVWVADAHRRGSDVLLWTCTPVDGECLEARPPGTDGLPFSLWTKVLQTTDRDPSASTSVAWPFFQAAAGIEGGVVPVWAAACTPGVCPLVDQVAANPLPGSEAWESAAQALAAPEVWVAEAPPGSSSVAVKLVPLRSDVETGTGTGTGINENPRLTEVATDPESPVHVFGATDNDGDKLEARAFVTAGGADQTLDAYGDLTVTWFPPADIRVDQDRFVVLTDGRGGTAVWTNHDEPPVQCVSPEVTGYQDDGAPLPPGGQLELVPYSYGTVYAAYLGFQIAVANAPRDVLVSVQVLAPNGTVIGSTYGVAGLTTYDPNGCTGVINLLLPLSGGDNLDFVCRLGGRSVTVLSSVFTYSYSYSSYLEDTSTITYPPGDFVQEQVISLPPELPCSL